jgi:hypothetical protein
MEIGGFGYLMFSMAGAGALAMAFLFYKAITVDNEVVYRAAEQNMYELRVQRQLALNNLTIKCAACVHRATHECGYYPLNVPDAGACSRFVSNGSDCLSCRHHSVVLDHTYLDGRRRDHSLHNCSKHGLTRWLSTKNMREAYPDDCCEPIKPEDVAVVAAVQNCSPPVPTPVRKGRTVVSLP